MLLACAALIGTLCVPPQYVEVAQFSAMYNTPSKFDPALSKRLGIEIMAWTSDQIFEITSLGLDRVCAQGWCVYYRKHCDEGGRHCKVVLSDAVVQPVKTGAVGLITNTGFEIHAPSRAAMRTIVAHIGFQLQDGMGQVRATVPLGRFDRESADTEHFMGCRRSVWVEGCGRPPFPNFARPEHL